MKERVFRIFLSPLQSAQFEQVLAQACQESGVSGIFATVRPAFDFDSARVALELQVAKLDRITARKIQATLAGITAKTVGDVGRGPL